MNDEERLYGTVDYANALHLHILGLEKDMLCLLVQIRGGRY